MLWCLFIRCGVLSFISHSGKISERKGEGKSHVATWARYAEHVLAKSGVTCINLWKLSLFLPFFIFFTSPFPPLYLYIYISCFLRTITQRHLMNRPAVEVTKQQRQQNVDHHSIQTRERYILYLPFGIIHTIPIWTSIIARLLLLAAPPEEGVPSPILPYTPLVAPRFYATLLRSLQPIMT